MKKIAGTTLCCIDCINHDLAIKALRQSMAGCAFDRVLFLTDKEFSLPGIDTIRISSLESRDAYSSFVLHDLAQHIHTDFVLLVQWDGHIVNPAAWTDEFLEYDYNGAVWTQLQDAYRVGNGGFSLRSRKLLLATQTIPLAGETLNEDELICRKHRPRLEAEYGIRFAPEPLANRFSFEISYPAALPFGFHALFNLWLVLPPAEVEEYVASLPANIVSGLQFFQLGINYRDLRQFRFAELIFRRILVLQPDRQDAKRQLAALGDNPFAAQKLSRNAACPCGSGERYKNCCGKDPVAAVARGATRAEDIQWLLSVGMKHHQVGHLVHAAAIYRFVLDEQPDNAIAMQYLGVTAYQSGDCETAIGLIEGAISIQSSIPDFHNNLGLVFQAQGRLDQAIGCYRHALSLNVNYVEAYNNLGLALEAAGKPDESLAHYEHAIALRPDFAQAHWNYSIALLVTGDFARGWPEYEWRLKTPELAGREQRFSQPLWDGAELGGKTILLHAEQGFGDAIQFIRYVPQLVACGGRVLVECKPALKRLFESLPGVAGVVVSGARLPYFDVHCPMLSLPARFNTALAGIPAAIPYFSADPKLSETWRQRLPDTGSRRRIGLVWAGSPEHKNDRNRSMTLEQFGELTALDGTAFFSLQKSGAASRAVAARPDMQVCDLTGAMEDFADLAALIAQLDLVICVDTSVAHLAGAMGKPVWVLLPFAPDWRWLREREDSPWYPSMRLFRQSEPGNWKGVLDRMRDELQRTASA